jgi:PST family polysaccharide transporter
LVLAGGLILNQASAYLTRVMVSESAGLTSAGWYQAAITLAATMPAFALNAMGASLYPQLVAAPDQEAAHALVNRQLQIALLVTGPALIMASTLASPLVWLLFARGFEPAVDLVRWIALGTFGRLVVWPIGYLLLARSASRIYLLSESVAAALMLGCTWWLVKRFGTLGSGIAYAVAYALFSLLLLGLAWRLHRFRLNRLNLEWIAVIGLSLGLIQLIFAIWPRSNPEVCGLIVSLVITATAGIRIWRLTREGAFLRS